jgi:hypothetical protein
MRFPPPLAVSSEILLATLRPAAHRADEQHITNRVMIARRRSTPSDKTDSATSSVAVRLWEHGFPSHIEELLR